MTELQMKIHRRTDRAVFASATEDEGDAIWLPLSLVEVIPQARYPFATISMPEWLAIREGLV